MTLPRTEEAKMAEAERRLGLALALETDAVSMDTLVRWTLARPVELWAWLEAAKADGRIIEDALAGRGHFRASAGAAVLARASPEDWRAVAACEDLIPRVALAVRDAARARDFPLAERICQALLEAPRDRFPGGELSWVRVVVGCFGLFPNARWLGEPLMRAALSIAVSHGDLRSQVTLQGAIGWLRAREGDLQGGLEALVAAREAALALDDRSAEREVQLYFAIGRLMQGRPGDCIREWEALQRDVPYPTTPLSRAPDAGKAATWECPFGTVLNDPIPEDAQSTLAWAYVLTGAHAQAFEILNGLVALGEREGRPALTWSGRTILALMHGERRDAVAARALARQAFEFWRSSEVLPRMVWVSAMALAWSLWRDGNLDELHAVLEEGQRARMASGYPHYYGSALLDVLEGVETSGLPPVAGLTLHEELERLHRWPDVLMQGVAHRFTARRKARGPLDDRARLEIDHHLEISATLLRAAGSTPELALTLREAASWAISRGSTDKAAELQRELAKLPIELGDASPTMSPRPSTAPVLAERVLILGRLGSTGLGPGRRWGDLAARICEELGVERCALVDTTHEPVVLTARGGDAGWAGWLVELLSGREAHGVEVVRPREEAGAASQVGQLVLVPFVASGVARRGWLCLENRCCAPLVGREESLLLEALGIQIGVLVDNVSLWRDLEDTRRRLELEVSYYRDLPPAPPAGSIIGHSEALRQMLDLIERVASSSTAVLIHGETGSGKELVARELHERSPRKGGPLISVHIASLAPGLVASGLFGHERGAFTGATSQVKGRFELADRGTLFLDEIGELGPEDQVRLLRVLQEGVFERVGGARALRSDFRLVVATNRDLEAEVRAGRFREDLYYRLNVFPIRVPPLRERPEDIPTLALYFMARASRNTGRVFEGIAEADMLRLQAYAWPGNVRELEHLIERAALLSEPPRLRIPQLAGTTPKQRVHSRTTPWVTLEEAERRYVREVLEHTWGRITGDGGAAAILGLNPSTLNFRIAKLGLRNVVDRIRSSRLPTKRR
jgi:transcriptional regulator with GAF, ATPase, and Fis domain